MILKDITLSVLLNYYLQLYIASTILNLTHNFLQKSFIFGKFLDVPVHLLVIQGIPD